MIAGSAQRVRVALDGDRAYDVAIGPDAVASVDGLDARAIAVLYDRGVEPLARRAIAALGDRVVLTRALDGGEAVKSWALAGELLDALAAARLDRDAMLVAIGGGTVTDLGGFVAATYLRGIRWCAIPTTLLAAVDAAVGGKTAVNLAAGKNLAGAFHQPSFVAIDTAAFATLDARDIAAGAGEALKTAVVADAELFAYLEREMPRALAADAGVLAHVVARCVAAKADVVAGDEFERNGRRAVLNFGHTVGHALEKTAGYGTIRHGEAVTLGMRPVVALSRQRGLAPAPADRIDALLRVIPTPSVTFDPDALIAAMGADKKRRAGRLRFVLIGDLAEPYVVDDVDEAELRTALATLTTPA